MPFTPCRSDYSIITSKPKTPTQVQQEKQRHMLNRLHTFKQSSKKKNPKKRKLDEEALKSMVVGPEQPKKRKLND